MTTFNLLLNFSICEYISEVFLVLSKMKLLVLWIITILYVQHAIGVYMENSAYKDIVVEVSDSVPVQECSSILKQLEVRIWN